MDWGIAVSLDDSLTIAPLAREVRNIEGTPVYMAPEMAGGRGTDLGTWSDVYLLGATLHHLLTGGPPHDKHHIHAVLTSAFVSAPPTYSRHVPRELAAIARRALSRDPTKRFPHAAAFAHALDDYLVHRASNELCEEAETRASELARHVAAGDASEEVEVLFHESSFAFRRSLREWPENPRALAGRRALLDDMISFELDRGGTKAALRLLSSHDAPSEQLVERVRQAEEKATSKSDRLASLERDVDHGFGVRGAREVWPTSPRSTGCCVADGSGSPNAVRNLAHRSPAVRTGWCWAVSAGCLVLRLHHARQAARYGDQPAGRWPRARWFSAIGIVRVAGARFVRSIGMARDDRAGGASMSGAMWTTLVISFGRAWIPMAIGHFLVAIAAWVWPAFHFEIFALTAIPILMTARWMAAEAAEAL